LLASSNCYKDQQNGIKQWSQSFHSHLAHFSCLDQGWAVIRNSTEPPLGIRAVLRDHDHGSQKVKYQVQIYKHSYQKVKYPVLISNHGSQFLGFRFWVWGFRFGNWTTWILGVGNLNIDKKLC
jgi:hypothetical protein